MKTWLVLNENLISKPDTVVDTLFPELDWKYIFNFYNVYDVDDAKLTRLLALTVYCSLTYNVKS